MMRRLGALMTGMVLLLTGCSQLPGQQTKEDSTKETVVVYQALPLPNLFVDIPEEFEETSSEFYEKYYICEDASIIITEDKATPNTTAKDYCGKALLEYQEMCSSVEVLGNESLFSGDLNVETMEFTYIFQEGDVPYTVMVGFATDTKSVFIVTCKSQAEHYETYRDSFLTVMQSLRIDRTGE